MIYLAGPFFNEVEASNMEFLEQTCDKLDIRYFSPRKGENSKQFGKAMRDPGIARSVKEELAEGVFRDNVEYITESQIILAVIDGRDTGTMWEIGYAFALEVPVVTITFQDFGLNIMIGKCSHGHFRGKESIETMLSTIAILPAADTLSQIESMSDPKGDMI